jgi:hypothetical protein
VATITVWDRRAIDAIESGDQRELSCGYSYRPIMRPGIFAGKRYDGVMRDIVGNHVALVESGRVRWLNGDDDVDMQTYLAAVGVQRRLLVTIGLERRARAAPTLAQYLAERAAAETAPPRADDEAEKITT